MLSKGNVVISEVDRSGTRPSHVIFPEKDVGVSAGMKALLLELSSPARRQMTTSEK
jgi:hypothetical protein